MAIMHISADAVAALGAELGALAGGLLAAPEAAAADSWALGHGESADELVALLGNWRHERLRLAERLDSLGQAARSAGEAYVEVESVQTRRMSGGVV
ncbi:MAG: hypothetical protein LWW86_06040 [Micrococcales bacterium]|nr:hypothetical protein [Micrococcales bacterium]